jgi:hypothetical protein
MVLPIRGAPDYAPNPPFPTGGQTQPDVATSDTVTPASAQLGPAPVAAQPNPTDQPHHVTAPPISDGTDKRITELRQKRMLTARQADELSDLERTAANHVAFYKWSDRVHAAMPEFARKEAIGIAMHAAVEPDWIDGLSAILRALAADQKRPPEMCAEYASAAEKARHIAGSRLHELQSLVRGIRIGNAPY